MGSPTGSFRSAALKTGLSTNRKPFQNGLAGEERKKKTGEGLGRKETGRESVESPGIGCE